jgi:hypothetical protein
LNDGLGAFIARKQCRINGTALEVHANVVEDGIEFRVANKGILGVQEFPFLAPGKFVITASNGKPVVTSAYNLVLVIHDAGPYLRIGILATLSRKQGDAHKIFIPGNVI